MKWWKGLLGLETDGIEAKSIIGQGDALATWSSASRNDDDNFRTNQVTLAQFQDHQACRNPIGLAATWACVRLISGTIASLPLMVYRTDKAGVRTVARDHSLYWILHDSPNYDQTAFDFWGFQCAGIELQGNAYAQIEKRFDGSIISLTPIRPDLVTVRRGAAGLEYSWTVDGKPKKASQGEVLHIRGFGGGPLGGASVLSVCRNTFGAAGSAEQAASNVFANGIQTTGVFSAKDKLSPDQMKRAEEKVTEKYVGAQNAGRPLILNGGMSWQQVSISPEDAQMLETRRYGVEEICRVFGIPPHMIGHTENSTSWGTGLEQQTLGFQKYALGPRLENIEQSLQKQLLTAKDRLDGITIEFNVEGLLRADSGARSAFYASALMNGWMTINEVRALENMPPVDGGETPRMQMQNVPITEAGQAPPAAA